MKFKIKDEHKAHDKTLSQEVQERWNNNNHYTKYSKGVVKVVKAKPKIVKELKGDERFKE